MINTGLNRSYKASDRQVMDFSPIPDGTYNFRVKEISPWKAETKTIKVYTRDENNRFITNEKGEKVSETIPNVTFYNAMVKLEVIGGEYEGRIIFHNITTHPNMDWSIANFLDAVGVVECNASDIPTVCKSKLCTGVVETRAYDKKVQDKETGIDKIEKKYVNSIKSFKQMPSQIPNADIPNDMGI